MDADTNFFIRTAAYEAVAQGDAEIVDEQDGEPVFRLTDSGRERAQKIIDTAIRHHGHLAAEALAEALEVSIEIGEALVATRQKPLNISDELGGF